MRKFCVLLCLSFFVSLIHAAGMPVFASSHEHEQQLGHMTHVDSDHSHVQQNSCDDCGVSHTQVAKKVPAKCHTSAQCCTAIATLSDAAYVKPSSNQAENFSTYSIVLLTGQSLDGIFRPPRI